MYERDINSIILQRLTEPRRFIQVISGPRQVGKTTSLQAVLRKIVCPTKYVSADDPGMHDRTWIEQQWQSARLALGDSDGFVMALDEIQKVPQWSEIVKRLWDEDSAAQRNLKVVLLGSAPLLIGKGLTESLAGRFEVIHARHWSFPEMRDAFGWNFEQYVVFGGYPGAAPLVNDPERWLQYVTDSLIESTVSRDILSMNRVDKPALLRQLFQLGCGYSAQIVSYQKMLGQLQDAGNATTLAHYLRLLQDAGMLAGIPKYSGRLIQQKASSPKLQVLNTSLMTAMSRQSFREIREAPDLWGRYVESAVGAHLFNSCIGSQVDLFYWRDRDKEVDYVLKRGKQIILIEVKSGRRKSSLSGMDTFEKALGSCQKLLVGADGMSFEKFMAIPILDLFG